MQGGGLNRTSSTWTYFTGFSKLGTQCLLVLHVVQLQRDSSARRQIDQELRQKPFRSSERLFWHLLLPQISDYFFFNNHMPYVDWLNLLITQFSTKWLQPLNHHIASVRHSSMCFCNYNWVDCTSLQPCFFRLPVGWPFPLPLFLPLPKMVGLPFPWFSSVFPLVSTLTWFPTRGRFETSVPSPLKTLSVRSAPEASAGRAIKERRSQPVTLENMVTIGDICSKKNVTSSTWNLHLPPWNPLKRWTRLLEAGICFCIIGISVPSHRKGPYS